MSETQKVIERFVQALAARDLDAAMALYATEAVWEVHVPGGDGLQEGVSQIAALMEPWFTGRDDFQVVRHRIVEQDATVALQWEVHWRDEADGAPCISHQSHFFEIRDSYIQQHWLYCSGVRVYDLTPEEVEPAINATAD